MDQAFEDWVQEARSAKIEHVAEALGIRMPARGEYQGPCPACNGTDRFSINTKKQVFNCRGSGGGDALSMVQHVNGCDFVAACEYVNNSPPPRGESRAKERDPSIDKERREERRDADAERIREEDARLLEHIQKATRLFESGIPIEGTLAQDYFEDWRGLDIFAFSTRDLRFRNELEYWGKPGLADKDADGNSFR